MRVRAIRDVIEGWARAREMISVPMNPFAPERISFMMVFCSVF